jgi:hypothetical protein
MDFLKERAYSHYPRSVEEPKHKNEQAVAGIDQTVLQKAAGNKVERVNFVLKKAGDIFSIYSNYTFFYYIPCIFKIKINKNKKLIFIPYWVSFYKEHPI